MPVFVLQPLLTALAAGDDPALWELVARTVVQDVERVFDLPEAPPRQVHLAFARVRAPRHPDGHPDDAATWRLWWQRGRGESDWEAVGENPHLRRKRGQYTATVCVGAGSRGLARSNVTVIWRPRAPWAEPEDTEIARVTYEFERDSDGNWQRRGTWGT